MPKTVLLADDSVTIQKVVGISFANEDVVLLTVDNGDDAIARAREARPDIVLADVVMPGANGYEVCEALKKDAALRDVPVLLLTGTFEAFDEERAARVGADGHITKPFEAQALVDQVNARLAERAAPAAERAPEATAPAAAAAAGAPESVGPEEVPSFLEDEATAPETAGAGAEAEPELELGGSMELGGDGTVALELGEDDLEADEPLAVPAEESAGASAGAEARLDAPGLDAPEEAIGFAESDLTRAEPPEEAPAEPASPAPGVGETRVVSEPETDPLLGAEGAGLASEPLGPGLGGPEEGDGLGAPPSGDPLENAGAAELEREAVADPDAARDYDVSVSDLGDPLAAAADAVTSHGPASEAAASPAAEPPAAAGGEPAGAEAARSVAPDLSPAARQRLHDALERIAWEAFGDVSERIVTEALERIEKVAWEVIPQMAEALIEEEIRRLKEES